MKFSEINENQWDELKPYLDTALLPVTGLNGTELPWEATRSLEQLRDTMDLIEIPFKGRVVTYPALHFAEANDDTIQHIERVCQRLIQTGFRHVITVTACSEEKLPLAGKLVASQLLVQVTSDMLQNDPDEMKRKVSEDVQRLWQNNEL